MPVGADQGASTLYAGEAEEARRPPRGVGRLERKSIFPYSCNISKTTKKVWKGPKRLIRFLIWLTLFF
ncbi:hypothetical protein FZC79_03490 [Rossellomorea vietnamensis]|uniref:Uncharacterized protein n=1 Tax=Rossellomorea vietnamensis TaxID=218284 RepID=A0A5D4KJA9_9BACI|nr:hypothetical protein FZC79_03490 [Rossellomorea vietnamensis]